MVIGLAGMLSLTIIAVNVFMTSCLIYASVLALSLVDWLMNIIELVFAEEIPACRYFACRYFAGYFHSAHNIYLAKASVSGRKVR